MITRRATTALVVACIAVGSYACTSGGDQRARGGTSSTSPADAPTATTATTTQPRESVVARPQDLVAAKSASALAATLTRVERALRDPSTSPASIASLGWEQQLAYRTLSNHDDWDAAVLAATPADVSPVVASMVEAGRSLAPLVEPGESLPDWRIDAPPAAEVLVGFYREAEAATGVPWPYLAAINFVETRMGRIHGNSTAGAQGPMQFIASTWDAFGNGGDVHDPHDSILAAGRYLASRGAPADMRRALYSYNNSDDYVDSVQRYADLITADQERVYRGLYQWQVYFATTRGLALLPEGYPTVPAVFLPPV